MLPDVILLATTNRKKVVEMRPAMEPLGIRLADLSEIKNPIEVEETGTTFIENARIKAVAQAKNAGIWAIGEDSGLCVPSLNGQPGVYSARFAGVNANDTQNNALLLEKMKSIESSKRDAYYVSTMVLADPSGKVLVEASGECWGRILGEARGEGGFGYDPLFEVVEYHQTFAELGLTVKRALSHRGRALRSFVRQLELLAKE